MTYTGIRRGDKDFRHFTFNENDFIIKDNIKYYKVNYGKNKLEGPDAEDEVGYIDASNIIVLGGNKPSFLNPVQQNSTIEEKTIHESIVENSSPEQKKEVKSESSSKKSQDQKRSVGRPKKEKTNDGQINTSLETPNPHTEVKREAFKYTVRELVANDTDELEKQLNLLGSDGWEMCGFDTYKNLFTDIRIILILKKRVS